MINHSYKQLRGRQTQVDDNGNCVAVWVPPELSNNDDIVALSGAVLAEAFTDLVTSCAGTKNESVTVGNLSMNTYVSCVPWERGDVSRRSVVGLTVA